MSASLRAFVTKALERNRISFGDLRRLQRTVLPHGLLTREQAEVLIALEQTIPPDRQGLGRLPRRRPHRLRGLALQLARPGRARDGGMAGGQPLLRTANSDHRDDRPCHRPGGPALRGALVGLRAEQPQALKYVDGWSRSREPRLDTPCRSSMAFLSPGSIQDGLDTFLAGKGVAQDRLSPP
jgi:hypothetical protein